MKTFNVLILISAFLVTSMTINGMAHVAKRAAGRPAKVVIGPKTRLQARKSLRQKRDDLKTDLQQMEETTKREYEILGSSKVYSNDCIRYASKQRAKVNLENVEEQLSKKVPSKKQVALLEAEKSQLLKETEQLARKQAYLEKHNSWKLYNDYDFVTLPLELNKVKLDTIEQKLAKYAKKQQRQSTGE